MAWNSSNPHEATTAKAEESVEAKKLEFLLRVLTGLALAAATYELVASFVQPERHTRAGALIAIVVCLGMFVRWSSLPLFSKWLTRPGTYLGVLSKLVLGVTLAFAPYLVSHGRYAAAGGALVFALASFGLWMRWRWVAWIWYVLLAFSFWAMAQSFWAVATGTTLFGLDVGGIWLAFHAIPRLFSLLLWLVFLAELVQWQRELTAEHRAKETAAAASRASASGPAAPAPPSAATSSPTPAQDAPTPAPPPASSDDEPRPSEPS